ncbi:aldolase [Methanococcus voltae]|uniref:aldolase n=1 Tax=Methanococcus voltae TaxID=2188 RepID=UPI001AE37E07
MTGFNSKEPLKLTHKIDIPLDVWEENVKEYISNYNAVTKETGKLFIFAGDQKIEHLNNDFKGDGISIEDSNPDHLFKIAKYGKIGAFATQFGLICRYGRDYPDIDYIVKLNSKTNLVETCQKDPISTLLIDVNEIVEFKKRTGLKIRGIGYTIYLGSEFENIMLSEASRLIHEAHKNGLIAVIWIYPRGKAIRNEKDSNLIAGATGVGACIGADFVKVNYPKSKEPEIDFKDAVASAGRTKVICAGGSSKKPEEFLKILSEQINISGASGCATGRNIHQKSLLDAVALTYAINEIVYNNKIIEDALEFLKPEIKEKIRDEILLKQYESEKIK